MAAPGQQASRILGSPVPEAPPPDGLWGFYWYFIRQARALFGLLFVAGLCVALLDALIPVFIGRVVGLLSAQAPGTLLAERWPELLGMAAVLLLARPASILAQNLIGQQAINAGVTSMIRWQSHWHVVRQGWSFFQEDFAGRIANRVMQAGPALRESVVQSVNAVWYILVYGTGAVLYRPRPMPGWRCPSWSGSPPIACCCASSCRACASAPAPPPSSAACSPAASSTATPTSSRSSSSRAPRTRTPSCARASSASPPPSSGRCG
ncbi:ABC transporter ATP-binding protein [Teichococcus aestuarii]|uniref:hypothetical protein n=1 Tax=Teichococcus aestuarii TaxID=568898 RepID=UPI00361E7C96